MPDPITTRNAYLAIRACRPFKAGALRGYFDPAAGTYVVKSYAATIAEHRYGEGWTVNDEKYSVTTSRHQHQVRLALSDYNRSE